MKVFKAKQSMLYENERKIMEELCNCPGVIHIENQQNIDINDDDPYRFILMEYAKEGSMFEFL